MAKSYAQVNGYQVVDWRKELQLLIEGKESKADLKLAGEWNTCYVGQQSEMIERTDIGIPDDEILNTLGSNFTDRIVNEAFEEALVYCDMIDIRIAYLLKCAKNKLISKIQSKENELKELKLSLKKF